MSTCTPTGGPKLGVGTHTREDVSYNHIMLIPWRDACTFLYMGTCVEPPPSSIAGFCGLAKYGLRMLD